MQEQHLLSVLTQLLAVVTEDSQATAEMADLVEVHAAPLLLVTETIRRHLLHKVTTADKELVEALKRIGRAAAVVVLEVLELHQQARHQLEA